MQKENIIRKKSFQFAVRIVNLYTLLLKRKESVMSKQLLRSGTSIGANVREAMNAESVSDFIHKMGIAQKECDETCYWLELLHETEILTQSEFDSISQDGTELLKIIRSIILSSKKNRQSQIPPDHK